VNAGGQAQVCELKSAESEHIPPFWQGDELHCAGVSQSTPVKVAAQAQV